MKKLIIVSAFCLLAACNSPAVQDIKDNVAQIISDSKAIIKDAKDLQK